MNKANFITIVALLSIAAVFPVYMMREPVRMEQVQVSLRQKELNEAYILYSDNCVSCHGLSGEGLGRMPALNNPALAEADAKRLFNKIAHAPHNTPMAAWHVDEGGSLNTYQVTKLVSLIRFGNWDEVALVAATRNEPNPLGAFPDMAEVFLQEIDDKDHQCVSCHEEPELHLGVFGAQCARCHTISAWAPAYLTLHIFVLEHGENEAKNCESCHPVNYPTYTCYGCHDHTVEDMERVHKEEQIEEFSQCAACHPTGVEGEAARLRDAGGGKIQIELSINK